MKTHTKYDYYLSYELHPQHSEVFPLSWESYFKRSAPIAIEIGFGNGDFLIDWAATAPETNLVGIEISMACMERLQRKLFKTDLTNIIPIKEDARFAIRELFSENSVSKVMMNFPDPWPKDRHESRRLIDENFSEILANKLIMGHTYELVTDQDWYAEHTAELFAKSPYFSVAPIELNPVRPVVTKYEQKWRELKRNSYRVLATKTAQCDVNKILEEGEMPHAFVEKSLILDDIKNLVGFTEKNADSLFVVKDLFFDESKKRYLLKTIAKDVSFQQTILVGVYQNKENKWIVKLDSTIQPYRTPSVKNAVWSIGKKLNS